MKTTKKTILTVLMILLSIPTMFAQLYEWQMSPKPNEEYVGMITDKVAAGTIHHTYVGTYANGLTYTGQKETLTDEVLYERLYAKALGRYSYNSGIKLRNFKASAMQEEREEDPKAKQYRIYYYYNVSAVVVKTIEQKNTTTTSNNYEENEEDDLSKALDKALQDIREGSRIAIDQVRVLSGMDKSEYKDQIVEILLDKGYKVVAKEYLEKLYDEQQAQQSGIYNDRTTVKENNFSAVGYYLNVRLTETSLRVQIINVSTGEYDANVTIKL
jgi:hypothetical protein